MNDPPNPGLGVHALYLWLVEGCPPSGGLGASAAEFKLQTANWTITTFVPSVPNLIEIGGPPDASGKNFLMAIPDCLPPPFVIGSVLVTASGEPGRLDFVPTDPGPNTSSIIATVDCGSLPFLHEWPDAMEVIGYATQDAGLNQHSGKGCIISIESESWGGVKAPYR